MKKPIRKIADYLILSLIISTSILLVLLQNGNKKYQLLIILSTSLVYILWGIVHHLRERTFRGYIIFEYLAFSLLGAFLVIGLL